MAQDDIFEQFNWHSSIGIDQTLSASNKRFVTRLPTTRQAMAMFVSVGRDFLIHKTTKCLWKMSDDKKSIEPVFSNDVMTEEEVKAAMEE